MKHEVIINFVEKRGKSLGKNCIIVSNRIIECYACAVTAIEYRDINVHMDSVGRN